MSALVRSALRHLFKTLACAALVALTARAQGAASEPDFGRRFAAGVTAGSDGAGADLQFAATRWLVARVRVTWLDFDYSGDSGALRYTGRFKLTQAGGYLDLHPFSNAFVLSAGAATGAHRVDLSARAREAVVYRGVSFLAPQVGTVTGRAQLSDPAPFVGIGYDDTFTTRRRIGLKLLLGAEFSHPPDVTLAPQSGLAAQFPDALNLSKLASDIRHDGSIFQAYPAISAGVTLRF